MNKAASPDILLSNEVSILDYSQMERAQDKQGISEFVRARFTERYITPLRGAPELKHGFCTMAICCLMIEALESFWQGWGDSRQSKGAEIFASFFNRNRNLGVFKEYARNFYSGVRCGILHQAETSNGWYIRRDGPLLNVKTKTINATLFHNELETSLNAYCATLAQADWDSSVWENCRKKIAVIIAHCEADR